MPKVSVVDDDVSVRESLESLIRSVGLDRQSVRLSGGVLELERSLQCELPRIRREPAGHEWDRTPPPPAGAGVVKCPLFSLPRMDPTTLQGQKLVGLDRCLLDQTIRR